jgi:acyl-CoA dehydrogenase
MDLTQSSRGRELGERLSAFMAEHVYPNERSYYHQAQTLGPWSEFPVVDALKAIARREGLWNLFLPAGHHEGGLTNLEYAPLCEIMGRSLLAPELFNCSAPDTGNMETILRYGTQAQKDRWLAPLLAGEIRSSFAMTEPEAASSDATNIESSIVRRGMTTSSMAASGSRPAQQTRAARSSSSWARATRSRRIPTSASR